MHRRVCTSCTTSKQFSPPQCSWSPGRPSRLPPDADKSRTSSRVACNARRRPVIVQRSSAQETRKCRLPDHEVSRCVSLYTASEIRHVPCATVSAVLVLRARRPVIWEHLFQGLGRRSVGTRGGVRDCNFRVSGRLDIDRAKAEDESLMQMSSNATVRVPARRAATSAVMYCGVINLGSVVAFMLIHGHAQ